MNNKLWYINAALLLTVAAIWALGLMAGPEYPSEAKFKSPKTDSNSGDSDISDLESDTILATRGFSYWLDPPPAYGSVIVTIEPSKARELGGAWRVGGKSWLESGEKAENISPGKKLINFKSISEWNSPRVSAEVVKDQTVEITATYELPPQGTVKIVIEPEEALKLNPQWKVGDGDWLNSGQESQKTAVGNKAIAFKDIEGWDTPKLSVDVEKDKLTEATASYELIRYGNISVNLATEASSALKAAQWSLDNKTWYDFGCDPVKQRLGSYTISFKPVADWNTPEPLKLEMDEEITYEIEAEYLPIPYAKIKVTLKPSDDERVKSAQWRVDNGPWLNFDQIDEKVTLQEHKISFKAVNGWQKPDDIQLKTAEEITYELDCQYVIIKPPGPKFSIVTVIETGGGNGVVFTKDNKGYKVGEEIEDFKLIGVGRGKAFFEKEGFDYELEVKKVEAPKAPAVTKPNTPENNTTGRPTPPRRPPLRPVPGRPDDEDQPDRPNIPDRPGGLRRPNTTRS